MTTQNGNPANHLFAYAVEEYETSNGKKAKTWTRIGAAFPHREGPGFNVQLRAFPVDGRIVLLPPDKDSHRRRGRQQGSLDPDASHRVTSRGRKAPLFSPRSFTLPSGISIRHELWLRHESPPDHPGFCACIAPSLATLLHASALARYDRRPSHRNHGFNENPGSPATSDRRRRNRRSHPVAEKRQGSDRLPGSLGHADALRQGLPEHGTTQLPEARPVPGGAESARQPTGPRDEQEHGVRPLGTGKPRGCSGWLSREIGTKQLMTVLLAKKTEERPVPEAQRGTPALTDNQAAELVLLGNRVEALYGRPMDIEWALAEGVVAILQARPITALPNPPDTGWQLPPGSYMAIRNNIVELMADPLTPLFSTIGLTAVNTSLIRLLSNFFGRSDLMPPNVIINVNGYAYYNGSWSFSQLARILLRSGGIMKRMFSGAVERWTIEGRPQYVAAVEAWQREDWRELSAADLLQAVRVLSEAAVDAYGSLVSGVIPAAWISEGIFTFIYDKLIKRREDPPAPTFLMGYDSVPIMVEKVLYDLAAWINSHSQLALYFSHTTAGELAVQFLKDEPPRAVDPEEWRAWRVLFQAHLDQYGHTIYNLDFANPVPADDPAVLLDTIKLFLSGQGVNPYMRQEAAIHRRQEAVDSMLGRLKRLRLKLFRKTIAPAQRYAPLRENGLADVGLGYPLLRQVFRELGSRFAAGGMINTPDDIYWLIEEEVHDGAVRLDNGEILENRSAAVVQRKADWRAARRMTPPVALPQRKILGIDMQKIKAARAKKGAGDMLKGVAAGAGSVTAVACVVHGPEDFGRMKTGDVLVAAITTPAWTPLFARAAAVVTDVGGPLSHGSIVAREYGIPAVLGTGEATKRIRSGQRIRVNGDTGVVEILRQDQDALVLARPLLGV